MVDKKNHNKTIGIILLFAFTAIAIMTSILATSPLIKDSDPASYVIVVMLMVPMMAIFCAKEDLAMEKRPSIAAIGFALLIVAILLVSVLRGYLSFSFFSFRADALLFPLVIAAFAIPLFGLKGLKKLRALLIYSVFASPLLFYFLIKNQGMFVNWNASVVYSLLRTLGVPLARNGITFSSALYGNISIASTCAALGIFIAMFLFLIPVAYFYKGKKSMKAAWLLAAMALFLLLNILRMTSIGLIWTYYGANSAILVYHAFVGQFLFYITIAIMLLIAGKFGLSIGRISLKRILRPPLVDPKSIPYANILCALAIALLVALFTTPYLSLSSPSLAAFGSALPANSTQTYLLEARYLSSPSTLITGLGTYGNQSYFALSGNSIGQNGTVYAIAIARPSPIPLSLTLNRSDVRALNAYIVRSGVTLYSGFVISNSTNFTINFFSMPLSIGGISFTAGYELVAQNASSLAYCAPQSGFANNVESAIYNFLSGQKLPDPRIMCPAYDAAASG